MSNNNNLDLEIERKFLVSYIPDNLTKVIETTHPIQGYLSIDPNYEVRISSGREDTFKITRKIGEGLVRHESEHYIEKKTFDILWPLTEGRRVEKSRDFYDIGNYKVAEVDTYKGDNEGIVTVEVEFTCEDAAKSFVPPAWFGEEVTGNEKYKNSRLAK